MKEVVLIIKLMEKEFIFVMMVISIKENGNRIRNGVKEKSILIMD